MAVLMGVDCGDWFLGRFWGDEGWSKDRGLGALTPALSQQTGRGRKSPQSKDPLRRGAAHPLPAKVKLGGGAMRRMLRSSPLRQDRGG